MNLFLRLIYIALSAFWRPRLQPLDAASLHLRVLPNDLDIFMHVNNGRYLTLMDLGRVDMMLRNGMVAAMRSNGWSVVVARAAVNFKRPLKFWTRFQMVTRIVGWDARCIYVQQELYVLDKLMASGMIRTMMRDSAGAVPGAVVMAAMGYHAPSPMLPPVAEQLAQTEIVASVESTTE